MAEHKRVRRICLTFVATSEVISPGKTGNDEKATRSVGIVWDCCPRLKEVFKHVTRRRGLSLALGCKAREKPVSTCRW